MAIKKVVNKTKTVKKFPEFDDEKIYVEETTVAAFLIVKITDGFTYTSLTNIKNVAKDVKKTFKDVLEAAEEHSIYILNNQDELARFLLGCREFPKVEEIEVGEELAEDEVSVEDVVRKNPYNLILACTWNSANKVSVFHPYSCPACDSKYAFFESASGISHGNYFTSQEKCIKSALINNTVYQFDTQEEFLRWSLEQVTGKKFYHVSPGCCIPHSKEGSLQVLA